MSRLSRQEWLEQSLYLLAELGSTALTIDTLTQKLGVTKGSFYHHFSNYQTFKISLLELFEELSTLRIIRITDEAATPRDRLRKLLQVSTSYPVELEVQIRSWALQDKDVRQFQERIDKERVNYVKSLYLSITGDEQQATIAARLLYAVYVGGQQIIPPIVEADLSRMYEEIQKMFLTDDDP